MVCIAQTVRIICFIGTCLCFWGCDVASVQEDEGNAAEQSGLIEAESKVQLSLTVISTDGICELQIPSNWKRLSGRRNGDHELFEIQVGKRYGLCEIVVLSEPIEDFDGMPLDDYAKFTLSHFKSGLKNGYIDRGPFDFQMNGFKCKQYVVRGSYQGVNVVALFSAIRGRKGYYQIISYTAPSKLEQVKEEMLAVVRSFRER
jgi:hypothetical protein